MNLPKQGHEKEKPGHTMARERCTSAAKMLQCRPRLTGNAILFR